MFRAKPKPFEILAYEKLRNERVQEIKMKFEEYCDSGDLVPFSKAIKKKSRINCKKGRVDNVATRKSTRIRKDVSYQEKEERTKGKAKLKVRREVPENSVEEEKSKLEDSNLVEITKTKLKCFACDQLFTSKQDRKRHVEISHINFPCPFCEKGFSSNNEMQKHFIDVHVN
eukprot:GFUD01111749.1.p1 GENE.GFUD01111749.1~~GFUD01111749.1.p1  ORF type:complete len:171 (-),score=45.37 GFUD01111749.1:18-530(-)